ncbi:MAG: hypothetical protein JSU70_23300, partial [Phycisphaerales bacterium]
MTSNKIVACSTWTLLLLAAPAFGSTKWQHLSSKTGDLEAPNPGKQQTSSVVADFDSDGINDFAVTERTMAPSVVW